MISNLLKALQDLSDEIYQFPLLNQIYIQSRGTNKLDLINNSKVYIIVYMQIHLVDR